MFIAVIGTRYAGKATVERYLVNTKGFTSVRLYNENRPRDTDTDFEESEVSEVMFISGSDEDSTVFMEYPQPESRIEDQLNVASKHMSFLSMDADATPLPSPAPFRTNGHRNKPMFFSSPAELLDFVTRNWRMNFVTLDLYTRRLVEMFVKRPFFMLLSVDGPLYERYRRAKSMLSLEEFVLANDRMVFGSSSSLEAMRDLVDIHLINSYSNVSALHSHLEEVNLLNPIHLRPDWDNYFMTLASLASRRSNCMKRRVGAILVREHRIVSTGYNGTPRSLKNCNEGGCGPCNGTAVMGEECVCLHAEENALLEAGRERVGAGAVLYCNTCPCLKCTVKIIQTGIKEVVYNLAYKVDSASARLFIEAGVQLRRYARKNHQLGLSQHNEPNGAL